MHTGAFAAAGQRLADTDDSFSSAPRGILIGQIPQILRAKKFDGTRGGQRLDIWLEEIDKAIIVNPDVFRQWKGDATDRSIAEQSLPRKLADLAQVVVNNLSMRSGSASNVRISAESQINTELARLLDDCMSEGNANTQGLETLAKTGYMEKILDAIKSTLDGDAKARCKELGVHRFHEIRDEMVTLYFRKDPGERNCDGLQVFAGHPGRPRARHSPGST